MPCGLFAGRAVLSLSMILFFVAAFVHTNAWKQLKQFVASPLLLAFAFLFLIPFISGLWSQDRAAWLDVMRTKLPLLMLPLAFAGQWQLPEKKWRYLAWLLLLLVVGGTIWSVMTYLMDKQSVQESYLRAKLIQTPLENDHVRFSWLVNAAILTGGVLLKGNKNSTQRMVILSLMAWLILYLHILSARTGLVCFYLSLLAFGVYYAVSQRSKVITSVLLSTFILLPVFAWFALPTFANRVRYIRYDLPLAFDQTYLPGSNDGNRTLSFQAGWNLLKENFFGVGAGDVEQKTAGWYAAHVPEMLPQDKLLPSSQWLMYGCAAGWPGLAAFSLVVLVPFFTRTTRHEFYWLLLNATLAVSLLFDIGLEVQYGVFLYAFFVLWWYKWLLPQPVGELNP